MRFKVSATTGRLLAELDHLTVEIEPQLELVSAAARGEWLEMRSRFPTEQDLASGFTPISDEDLAVMHAKVERFREILGTRRHVARLAAPVIQLLPLEH